MTRQIIGVVPARGGSKGVPGKNVRMLDGKPLLLRTLCSAREAGCLDRIWVSTDSTEIRAVAETAGFSCPELRPAELATDDALIIDVLRHALERLAATGAPCTDICLLQPTSPFRTARHIREAVGLYLQSDCDTLVSVTQVPHRFHPKKLMVERNGVLHPCTADGPLTRHIEGDTLFGRNGPAILIVSARRLREGRLYGDAILKYEMDFISSIDIDDEADWALAETISRGAR